MSSRLPFSHLHLFVSIMFDSISNQLWTEADLLTSIILWPLMSEVNHPLCSSEQGYSYKSMSDIVQCNATYEQTASNPLVSSKTG